MNNKKTFKKAAARGRRRAWMRIVTRKTLDWLSAAVYLLTFRPSYFKSVIKAHKEYRKLKHSPDQKAITLYLQNFCTDATVTGIYRKWIVLQSILKGEDIFRFIIEDDFI